MEKMIVLYLLFVPLTVIGFEDKQIGRIYGYYDTLKAYMGSERPSCLNKTMTNNRQQLEKDAFPQTIPEKIVLEKKRNFAALVLGLYQIAGVGGPGYDQDGIRNIVTVLERYFRNSETLPICIVHEFPKVVDNCFTQALKKASNYYQAVFALAFLYHGATEISNQPKALEYLSIIIQAPDEYQIQNTAVDIALRDKARILKAEILLKDTQQTHASEIQDLLITVLASSHNDSGEFIGNCSPEDAQKAQVMLELKFSPQYI